MGTGDLLWSCEAHVRALLVWIRGACESAARARARTTRAREASALVDSHAETSELSHKQTKGVPPIRESVKTHR